eukprot:GHVS01047329.1.p1 GENE.GHVS01047329.1~~GHVS01047329.1.p1  ORF type:complete len:125 (+),score=17.34 GHVS01047329.1:76-450(+)
MDPSTNTGLSSFSGASWSYCYPPNRAALATSSTGGNSSSRSIALGDGITYNSMVAAAMYDSIKSNYDYILSTQYNVGLDKSGNVWRGPMVMPTTKDSSDDQRDEPNDAKQASAAGKRIHFQDGR